MVETRRTVNELLAWAKVLFSERLGPVDSSLILELHILFEHVSGNNRAWQMAHSDENVSIEWAKHFESLVEQRINGTPIAFITGTQAFWSLNLAVDTCTLIPRQDTESLIEAALSLALPENAKALDLGTGTGAIALALKKERSEWQVQGVDFVAKAVELARLNANTHNLDVSFSQSDWFAAVADSEFDLIVSNPPYVESDSVYLNQGDLRFEPSTALTSGIDGLDDIRIIVEQAYSRLALGGVLMLEHGFEQASSVRALMQKHGYVNIETQQDYNQKDRLTHGQKKR